jgi:hypothetical protein
MMMNDETLNHRRAAWTSEAQSGGSNIRRFAPRIHDCRSASDFSLRSKE